MAGGTDTPQSHRWGLLQGGPDPSTPGSKPSFAADRGASEARGFLSVLFRVVDWERTLGRAEAELTLPLGPRAWADRVF